MQAVFATNDASLTVKVGVYENKPKIYTAPDGTVSGFWPELLEKIAKTENWKVEYVHGSWSENLDRLKDSRIHILPDVACTKKRKQIYTFSDTPVLMSWSRIYIHEDNSEIHSITDLENKAIGVLKESVNFIGPDGIREIVEKFNINCSFVAFDNYNKLFEAVKTNKVDAGVTNREFGNKNAAKFNLRKTAILFQPVSMKFAFTKGTPLTQSLSEKLDYHLKKMLADDNSAYYQLLEKHFESEIAQKTVTVLPDWLSTVLKISVLLFTFLTFAVYISRVQIRRKTLEIENKNREICENETLLRTLIKNIPGVSYRCAHDQHWTIYMISDEVQNLTGYPTFEFIGNKIRSFASVIHPEDIAYVETQVSKQIDQKQQFSIEYRIIRADNEIRWVLERGQGVVDEKGRVAWIDGIILDITERKQLEEERERLMGELTAALGNVKTLSGLLPICAACKKIRDDKGYWSQIEDYIHTHSEAEFSHSICPECSDKFYGKEEWYLKMKEKEAGPE